MAQIRNFTSTNDSYFVLDGVSYPKVYEAMLDSGYTKDRVKLVGTNRDSSPLVFSTHYSNIRVDGVSFASANEAISRLNQVVFSKGGGSGGGGTFDGIATEDSATVSFTGNGKAGSPLKANNIDTYSTSETLTGGTWIDGKPIYRKVINTTGVSTNIANLNIDTVINQVSKLNTLTFDSNIPQPTFLNGVIFNSYLEITRVEFEEGNETPQNHLVYFVGTKITYSSLLLYGTCTVIKSNEVGLIQNAYDAITATSTVILEYTKTTN